MKYLAGLIMAGIIAGNVYAQNYTTVEIPPLDGEVLEADIRKYNITTFKVREDINNVKFTVVDKIEQVDLHQLEYDLSQEQSKIDTMNKAIIKATAKIAEINEMIGRIKGL